MTQETTTPAPAEEPPANPLALAEAALNAAGIIWIEVPDERPYTVWHAWVAGSDGQPGTAYVVNGPGEQTLPWLPSQVTLNLKSKDTGGRLTRVAAKAEVIKPDDPRWEAAAAALSSGRLNSTDDVLTRWREQCTITALTPVGTPLEQPTQPDESSGVQRITGSKGTTATWKPWHIRGRAKTVRAKRWARHYGG